MIMKTAAIEWKKYKATKNFQKDKNQFEEYQNSDIDSDDESINKNNIFVSDNGEEWSIPLYYEGQDIDFDFE